MLSLAYSLSNDYIIIIEKEIFYALSFQVTVERDLCIRRLFNWIPLLWTLLKFIANHRPALCYCSVLLRAVTATLIGQWSTAGQQRQQPGEDKQLVQTTVTLLQVMALGQLLPPPLSCLSDVISHLPPSQVCSNFLCSFFKLFNI